MSAVTLPTLSDALPLQPGGSAGAAADGPSNFSELLSTLATGPNAEAGAEGAESVVAEPITQLPEVEAAPAATNIVVAPAAAAPAAASAAAAAAQAVEVAPSILADVPQDASSPAAPAEWRAPARVAPQAAAEVDRQPPLVGETLLPVSGVSVSLVRSTRAHTKEPKAAELTSTEPKEEPAGWSMQQALAAVAAIAIAQPAQKTLPTGQAPKLPSQPVQAAIDTAAAISISRAVARPVAPALPVSADGGVPDEARMTGGKVPAAATESPLLLDPQVLTAALSHKAEAANFPQVASSAVPVPGSGTDLDLQHIDTLMRDIASLSGTTGRAAFRVTADQLGPIEVRLHSSEAGMAVTIRTHDEQSHATVAQAQRQLSDDLRANGLKVAATDVMLGGEAGRQRQERPNSPAALSIEFAAAEAEQSQSTDQQRPDGRYA